MLHQLLICSNQHRKEQMLLKFFLQLKTFSCDNVVRKAATICCLGVLINRTLADKVYYCFTSSVVQLKMAKPFNAENAAAHRKQLEEQNVAFVIVRHFGCDELPTPTNRVGRAANIPTITYASSCFLEMTRFTEEECIGQSWSILQVF